MNFLVIDTCTERGLIAYGNEQEILFEKELSLGLNQPDTLLSSISEALKPYDPPFNLKGVGVGKGPGSYTGIRIGVAVAQALAYCWKVPLIGYSSLEGFIPAASSVHFAAILDARIGGVYIQKGRSSDEGITYIEGPQVCSLEEVGESLEGVTHLVSPRIKMLQEKFKRHYPHRDWKWEEKPPSAQILISRAQLKHFQREIVYPPEVLPLLYLRQTEAEREKTKRREG